MRLQFLPVGNADAILIHFQDEKGIPRNICVDGGLSRSYASILKHQFLKIQSRGEYIDLWVVTHIDNDHIGATVQYFKDPVFQINPGFIDTFWFNSSYAVLPPDSDEISIKQGILLRDYLIKIKKCQKSSITDNCSPCNLHNLKLTVLSPNQTKLDHALANWGKREKGLISSFWDYDSPIEKLLSTPFQEDSSVFNGSSIAFLLEQRETRILFLGDSHPSVVLKSLKEKFGCSTENPLRVDLVKVSHHGSAGNTSSELLNLIDCRRFVFCSNGNGLPAKTTLVRIADAYKNKHEPTNFLFNQPMPKLEKAFQKEADIVQKLNFQISYLPEGVIDL